MVAIDDPIIRALDYGIRSGLKPDEIWKLTPWELNQWLKSKTAEAEDKAKLMSVSAVVTAWRTAVYMRMDKMPALQHEVDRILGVGGDRLSPEASADAMRAGIAAVVGSKKNKAGI